MGELINIRGKKLYIEDFGREHKQTLLYLHGGPGASCLDFVYHQAKVLSESVRVIAIDQRGVLRSEPLEANEPFGLEDLLLDCEALREYLKITSWSVLGHSFGGYVALRYAYQYPKSVCKLLYEAPCFDLGMSVRSLFRAAIPLLRRIGREELISKCEQDMESDSTGTELIRKWGSFCSEIGSYNQDLIYLHKLDPAELNRIYEQAVVTEQMWLQSQIHTNKLLEEGAVNRSLLSILPLSRQPSLLLYGKYDPVCCSYQKETFLRSSPAAEIVLFEQSAHLPRIEEPDKYTREVLRFLKQE